MYDYWSGLPCLPGDAARVQAGLPPQCRDLSASRYYERSDRGLTVSTMHRSHVPTPGLDGSVLRANSARMQATLLLQRLSQGRVTAGSQVSERQSIHLRAPCDCSQQLTTERFCSSAISAGLDCSVLPRDSARMPATLPLQCFSQGCAAAGSQVSE